MQKILETDRLILRGWRDEDAASLFKYASDDRIGPRAGWLPHKDVNYSRAVIRTILNRPETYAICLKGGGNEPIGSIGLTSKSEYISEAELGFWLGYPYWGKEIVPEAAKEMIRHGFEDMGLDRIFCGYFQGNDNSRRVQQKCGFEPHHVEPNREIPMLDEVRVEYINFITKSMWKSKILTD